MNEWETKSLEWIHKVREEIDKEIQKKGLKLDEWIKLRGKIDTVSLCKRMGLKNFRVKELTYGRSIQYDV